MTGVGIGRHDAGERLPRHRHSQGYVAVVLDGGYVEAGDGGRIAAMPGTVIVHGDHSAHLDRFGAKGARVLNLPRLADMTEGAGSLDDPDMTARLAECDLREAAAFVRETLQPGATGIGDWPDQLATTLRNAPDLCLSDWARGAALDPASVSRGFARAYGVSPKRYRLEARTRRAILALGEWQGGIAALAAEFGFADQAHLTRAVTALTGQTPGRIRAKSVQAGARSAA